MCKGATSEVFGALFLRAFAPSAGGTKDAITSRTVNKDLRTDLLDPEFRAASMKECRVRAKDVYVRGDSLELLFLEQPLPVVLPLVQYRSKEGFISAA